MTKVKVLILFLKFWDHVVDYRVLGDGEDYDRWISLSYPKSFDIPPTVENDWLGGQVPCYSRDQLKEALEKGGQAMLDYKLKEFDNRDRVYIETEAQYLPNIGELKVEFVTKEVDL
jgi:hypothetical protein